MLKGLFQNLSKEKPAAKLPVEPRIIPRAEHSISRKDINPNALKVLYRLHNSGFSAYLVGGCVRDLLLSRHPKDFDIATNALPEEVRKLFKNCRLIGKRFRLAHIVFGRDIIEVATFRTHHENAHEQHARMHQGMIVRDNVFGEIHDDAWRRDFTINALYYNIADFSVVDYTNGIEDIEARLVRMIGDPEKRFREDPVRLLRAIRIAGKLKLHISPETETPIISLSYLLQNVSSARLFQEVLKFFQEGALLDTFHLFQKYKLFEQLFPQTAAMLQHPATLKLIEEALENTDKRLREDKSVSPAFLLAIFLWHPIQAQAHREEENGMPPFVAFEKAIHHVIKKQTQQLAIPRQLQVSIRDICFLQYRFTQRNGLRTYRILDHPRFRAAYDLLMLRANSDRSVITIFEWWKAFYLSDASQRERMLKEPHGSRSGKKRRAKKNRSRAD